jgi:NitT/TauT family transport system permease protein
MVAHPSELSRRGHPAAPRGRSIEIPERLLFGAIGFCFVLVVWEAVVGLGLVRASLISSPTRIVAAGIADFTTGVIWPQILTSLLEWTLGFAIAIVVAIPLGFAVGSFRKLEYTLDPFLAALYSTPMVALVPLVILIFGVDLPSKVFIVFLFAVLPLTISTINGVHSAERRYVEIARSFRASRMLVFRSVTVPSSVPFIITGLRIGGGHALVGVVVGEFLAANAGLGFYISFNGTTLNTSRVFLGILLLGAFGVFIGEVILRIEHRFDRWRPSIQ